MLIHDGSTPIRLAKGSNNQILQMQNGRPAWINPSATTTTQIYTRTSGKFFVRNANGSLPSGIDSSKVWSLTEQKNALGGTMPSGKIHIELPVGLNKFHIAGGGGGGGGDHGSGRGSTGGTTSVLGCNASGGYGGESNSGSGRRSNTKLRRAFIASGITGRTRSGGGGQGGIAGTRGNYAYAGSGYDGSSAVLFKTLNYGEVHSYTIGSGGSGGYGAYGSGGYGEKGWIQVEYTA